VLHQVFASQDEAMAEHLRLTKDKMARKYILTKFANTITEEPANRGQRTTPTNKAANVHRTTRSNHEYGVDDHDRNSSYETSSLQRNQPTNLLPGFPLGPIALILYLVLAFIFWVR